MPPLPRVRLVVCNYDGGELVLRCLESLEALHWPADRLEIVVVDNASTDGSPDRIAAAHPGVVLVRNERNAGFGAAVNLGLGAPGGLDLGGVDLVGLVNPDAHVDPEWLTRSVAVLDDDPAVGAVCPKICFDEPDEAGRWRIQNAGGWIAPSGNAGDRGHGALDGPPYDRAVDVTSWCGAAVVLRSVYLDDVGRFDDRFFLYYEDADLSWRALRHGWRHHYEPSAVVWHRHGASTGLTSPLATRCQWRNRLLMVGVNAPAGMALGVVARSLVSLVATAATDVVGRLARGRRPRTQPLAARLAGTLDALVALPHVLARRRSTERAATIPRRQVADRWITPPQNSGAHADSTGSMPGTSP